MPHVTAFAVPAAARTSVRSSASAAATSLGRRPTPPRHSTTRTLIEKNGFSIRIADERSADAVDLLVRRMYGRRGYCVNDIAAAMRTQRDRSITLEATQCELTVGTVTVNMGGVNGLNAEALYGMEIAPYRRANHRPCEFTRLAMSTAEMSKEALGALFHVGLVFASRIFEATDLFIEVNPRHTTFYRNRFGFECLGEERLCPRVNAPAVLLHKDLGVCISELERLGGVRSRTNRTFYSFMLDPTDESAVIGKIPAALQLAS